MLISEIYHSKQGEGRLTGTPSVFIRTSGCNLRCTFCDTPFASWNPEGEQQTLEQIVARANQLAHSDPSKHVVITGGEPMIQKMIGPLTSQLRNNHFHITIETAGTVFQKVECDLMSISPKLSNSTPSNERAGDWHERHERDRFAPDVIAQLMQANYQLKFVVDSQADLNEIVSYLDSLPSFRREWVLFMPQGTTIEELKNTESWLQPYCADQGYTYCPRKHIEWYGNKRGT